MPAENRRNRQVFRATALLGAMAVVVAWLALLVGGLWALLALWFFAPWPAWLRGSATLAWLAFAVWAVSLLPRSTAMGAVAAGIFVVWLLWFSRSPSNQRDWTPDQAQMPGAIFDDSAVLIENVRSAAYRSMEDYEVRWDTRRYDLSAIRSVDFVVERFASWRGPAHTFLTFGFADGRHLSVSAEIRKERGESFSPLAGLFRKYEIMYVIGDECDLVGLRVNVRKHPVYLFPINAGQEHVRTLFVAMLERANKLRQQPEFYNTLTNSCSSNIVRHLEQVSRRHVPFDLRVLAPGYSDELAFDMGLIDFDGSLDEARARFRVRGPVVGSLEGVEWSRKLRESTGPDEGSHEE